jgi:RNA polymerase sigma-70 factor (ECF subfamily)
VDHGEILARLRERIFRFAASRLSTEAAEDVAQEVLLLLHEKYADVNRAEQLMPLALEITRFKILGARRKVIRRGEQMQVSIDDLPLAGSDPDPFDQAARREQIDRLETVLKTLGDRCRELFRLKLSGHTFAEIQKEMGVAAINTLYTWDLRCRKQLMEAWSGSNAGVNQGGQGD